MIVHKKAKYQEQSNSTDRSLLYSLLYSIILHNEKLKKEETNIKRKWLPYWKEKKMKLKI